MAVEIRKSIRWGCWIQCGAIAHVDKGKVVKLKGDIRTILPMASFASEGRDS